MRFSFPRRGHLAAIFTGIVIAAGCSSSSPAAKAFVYGTITGSGGTCAGVASMEPFLQIGTMGDPGLADPGRVSDGGSNHISCTVSGSGSTFSLSVSATSESTVTGMGGSMSLHGSNITAAGGTGLSGVFVGTGVTQGTYNASNCTLSYTTPEGPGGIEPGRVWGHVECDGATNGSVMVLGGGTSTCNIAVDFVFENCGS